MGMGECSCGGRGGLSNSFARAGKHPERQHIFLFVQGSSSQRTPIFAPSDTLDIADKATSPDFLKLSDKVLSLLRVSNLKEVLECLLETAEVQVAGLIPE